MVKEILTRWPVVRQLLTHSDGTGVEAMSDRTRNLAPKHRDAQVTRSVCPYCAVGCGQLVYHREGKLVSIEGDPASFISRGRLCPKGSDSFELLTHANRETRIKYRRPQSTRWEELELETAMDMIADRVWDTRERRSAFQPHLSDGRHFTGGADGAFPISTLVRDSSGNLYGTTSVKLHKGYRAPTIVLGETLAPISRFNCKIALFHPHLAYR